MSQLEELTKPYNLITVLGATAGGKTAFAAYLAAILNREIISADSRQVYRRMDIGTGKDLDDYIVEGKQVAVHLIDIVEPGYKYNVFEYQQDFVNTFKEIQSRGKNAIMCGGSGMYLEAVIKDYELINVPHNPTLREELEKQSMDKLVHKLEAYKSLHNISDTSDKKRLIRAIEIADYYANKPTEKDRLPDLTHLVLGIKFDRDSRRRRISQRLKQRLENGMIEEVQALINEGVDKETLIYYGLEYKYITQYIYGQISYNEMFTGLETAIHQFAKRQMTWFRRMERNGIKIHWLDGYMSTDDKINRVQEIVSKFE
ncbi:MAG: tRNA (adenosine(37)-N6)-dimethylallyltransferase MiaA [Bacteroidales bacterium]|nr:tRNA (adenosine(37)-N6)-dimethylallyltransferase MiaA [Bacteroidales bacterium]